MSLSWPPPHPTLAHADRFPANTEGGADVPPKVLGQISGWDIYGRAGNRPDPTLTSWINETLNNTPNGDEWGTYASPFRWMQFLTGDERGIFIVIELRTAEEVAAQSGVPNELAATGWSDAFSIPIDGLSQFGDDSSLLGVRGKVIRIMIREDLASGGAGAASDGRNFFVETVIHELGHAAMLTLGLLYGDGYVSSNLCAMFGVSTAQWNSSGYPWDQRVVEAAAETYKDIAFPNRRYFNRTKLKLPEQAFADFKQLMWTLVETPYWTMNNFDDMHVAEDQFFFNLGTTSYYEVESQVVLRFYNPDVYPLPNIANTDPVAFAWKPGFNGNLRLCWNYDPIYGLAGNVSDPGAGNRWADLKGPEWGPGVGGEGYPIYDFSWVNFVGNPGNHVRIELSADFFDIDTSFVHTGQFFGSAKYRLGAAPLDRNNPTDDDLRYIPPVTGVFDVNFDDIQFDTGILKLPDAFTVWLRLSTSGARGSTPKYTLYPGESGRPTGKSYIWPWVEVEGERAHVALRAIPWPYTGAPPVLDPSLNLGPFLKGVSPTPPRGTRAFTH